MIHCDFPTVTDTLMRNMASSATIYYTNLLNLLFGSYLAETHQYEFDRATSAKLHKGTIRVAPEMSDYYLDADRAIMCKDIKELLPYIFDKPNTYKELYELIQFDDSLSVLKRKTVLNRVSTEYLDEQSLVDIIYEAVYIAVTRRYEKYDKTFVAVNYKNDIIHLGEALFANTEYVTPCDYFCGRDTELDELHTVVQDNFYVIVTGIAGIGKSELVRKYVQEHKSEYSHIGYYFYKGNMKTIIANIISNPVITDEDLRYRKNLELLSSLGKSALLIIDNINVTPDDEECFYEVLEAGCKVIFTSHMKYDELCSYELKEFRSSNEVFELISKFYPYSENEKFDLAKIISSIGKHTFCIELCARIMKKGLYTPKTLSKRICDSGIKIIVERFAATKDKHSRKKTYYDHIKDLFALMELPERYKDVLRMAVVLPYFGVRKDFTAMLMGLQNLLIIEDLIEIGLIREYDNGLIAMQCIIRQFVKTELLPDYDNCRTLITSLRAVCVNESTYVPYNVMCDMLYHTVRCIDFHSFEDYFYLIHDFYKYIERFRDIFIAKQMLNLEEQLRSDNDKQAIVYFSDYASFEMMRNNYSKALELQEDAVHHSLNCDDILLQANTVNTYGYYLNLADRKEEALKAMQSGLALFEQLDGNGIFYYDKYRAIINYADLLFSLGNKDEAINLVSDTKKSLLNLDLQDTEIYADCLYSLGLYHLCLMKTDNAKDELIRAFKIFLRVHDKDSDFISAKCNELRKFAEMAKVNPQSYLNLSQLL